MEQHIAEVKERGSHCPFSTSLGIEVVELSPGYAKVAATVAREHHSWIGRTHGGWIMALADQAFSLAGNTIPGVYVAVQFNINFLASPVAGERVEAEARVLHQGRTLGVLQMTVTGGRGQLIATATGTVVAVGERGAK